MATRIYCDNCGNTVREPNKFCFGPQEDVDAQHYAVVAMQQAHAQRGYATVGFIGGAGGGGAGGGHSGIGGAGGGGQHVHTVSKAGPTFKVETIDLCDGCQAVWMDRVRNLTRESE